MVDGTKELPALGQAILEAEKARKASVMKVFVTHSESGLQVYLPADRVEAFHRGVGVVFRDGKVVLTPSKTTRGRVVRPGRTAMKVLGKYDCRRLTFGKSAIVGANDGLFGLTEASDVVPSTNIPGKITIHLPPPEQRTQYTKKAISRNKRLPDIFSDAPKEGKIPPSFEDFCRAVGVINAYVEASAGIVLRLKSGGGLGDGKSKLAALVEVE